MKTWAPRLAAPVSIFLITLLTYAGSLDGEFISDDVQSVRNNPRIQSLDPEHVQGIFTSFHGANYVPITALSLALDFQIWGLQPSGFHLTNALIHALCAVLVYLILRRLELGAASAVFVAVLWALHPLQVESVAWITERINVLSGLFFFAAFYVYLAYSEDGRITSYVALVALYVLALLSKMNTMVLPALFLAYEAAFRFRLRRRDVLASVPLFALGAGVAWYNLAGNPIHGGPYHGGSALVTWLTSSVVVMRYLGNALLPTDLSFHYDVPLRGSLLDPPVLLSVLGLMAMAAAALVWVHRRERSGFWVLWFVITLAPMLNLIPFRSLMQDRYLYLPLLGLLVLAANAAAAVAGTRTSRYAVAVAAGAAVLACALLSVQRVEAFDHPHSLWEDWAFQIPFRPGDPIYRRPGYASKVRSQQRAIAREPASAIAHHNLGALYFEAGRSAAAIAELERARELAPTHRIILETLGRAYGKAGRLGEAELTLRRAAELDPHGFEAHLRLAQVLLQRGDADEARQALDVCGRIYPVDSASGRRWAREREQLRHLEAQPQRPAR